MAESQRSPARVTPDDLSAPQRAELGGHRPFHISGAAPVKPVPLAAAGYAVADGDGVQVPVQHQAGAVACPRQPRVDVVAVAVHPAKVDVEAEFAQLGGVVPADFGLLHGHAGDLHQRLRLAGRSTRHQSRLSGLSTAPGSVSSVSRISTYYKRAPCTDSDDCSGFSTAAVGVNSVSRLRNSTSRVLTPMPLCAVS